jgi:Uncharacterized protein conserved in bacteria (DUF2066)
MMLRHGFLLVMAGFLLTLPAVAQTRSGAVFTVSNVAVDATAQSAVQAREIARADGERRAFRTLLERLTLRQEWSRLPKVTDADLFALVQDFEVTSERSSTVRYLATLIYRFRPEPVRRLLRDRGIAFTETRSKALVVLPVLTAGNRVVLWEDPNPWRAAWIRQPLAEGLVPMQVPAGDLAVVQAMDAQQALKGDKDALAAAGRHYDNGDVMVTHAVLSGSGNQRSIQLTTARYSAGFSDQNWVSSLKSDAKESDDDFFARAVAAVVADVSEAWKKATLQHTGEEATLTAVVPMTNLRDWVVVRDRLQSIPAIQRATLLSLSQEGARIEIRYVGDPQQLQLVLSQRDLVLAQGSADWTLSAKTTGQ